MFEATDSSGSGASLLTQYLSAGSRVESVLCQEDASVALVEKAYYYLADKM